MIKTKLVATVGPACSDDATIAAMIEAGVNVFRLNFSHGSLESHGASLERIRRLAAQRKVTLAVMGDLCGPKIRVGSITGGKCELEAGKQVVFQREPVQGTSQRLSSNYPGLIDDVEVGHRLFIDDGNILLRIIEKQSDELVCKCEIGGTVAERKGINLPDSVISAPTLTEKDHADLQWAMDNDLDFIALSFVRQPEDIAQLREILQKRNSSAHVVAKIEKPEAVAHMHEIIAQSDVVLVARGDLGVEMDVARVPIIQKEITLHCQRMYKPVIIATQMLQSMVDSPVPTRAEVSDVANAILDHTDAVMLSAETSIGRYPLEAVRAIHNIARETESFDKRFGQQLGPRQDTKTSVSKAVVHGVSMVADELETRLVAVWTAQGNAAQYLSRHRISQPIVALSSDQQVCRQMALLYGVIPICMQGGEDLEKMLCDLDGILLDRGLATKADQIVVVADTRPDVPGEIDSLFIHQVASSPEGSIQA